MAKIRIVLEFEQDEATITPAVLEKFWSRSECKSEAEEQDRKLGLESELALLAAVKTQPQLVRQLWLQKILFWLYCLENTEIHYLLKPVWPAKPGLELLVAELHEYARDYFIKYGQLYNTDYDVLASWVQDLYLSRVNVEDAEGVLLSSDDVPIRRSKKRS